MNLYWVILDFTGFYWVLLRFTGLYLDFTWILRGFTLFYLILLGFYWVWPSVTGFSWVLFLTKFVTYNDIILMYWNFTILHSFNPFFFFVQWLDSSEAQLCIVGFSCFNWSLLSFYRVFFDIAARLCGFCRFFLPDITEFYRVCCFFLQPTTDDSTAFV